MFIPVSDRSPGRPGVVITSGGGGRGHDHLVTDSAAERGTNGRRKRKAAPSANSFRQYYTKQGLLTDKMKSNEIYIRSSPKRRVLMSASAFSAAFTGTRTRMPPIFTTANDEDEKVLTVHESLQYNCKVLARHNISDQPLCNSTLLKEQFVKEYPDCTNYTYSIVEAAISEIHATGAKLDSALEKCARGDGPKIQFKALSAKAGVDADFDIERAREVIGPLMSIVSKNVDDAVKSDTIEGMKEDAPVRIYYTHDHVILAVAQALGIISEFDGRKPEFSSAIAIETWSSSEGFDIKIVMKNGLDSPFKSVAKFRFLDFKTRITPYTEVDQNGIQWDEQVKKVYTLVQFGKDTGSESTFSPTIPRLRTTSDKGQSLTYEILLVALMVLGVVGVLVKRRNTYTRIVYCEFALRWRCFTDSIPEGLGRSPRRSSPNKLQPILIMPHHPVAATVAAVEVAEAKVHIAEDHPVAAVVHHEEKKHGHH
ncbi:hypothetical protein PRIPAC_79958 [Pristionchus pacificus]|uniref:acid phosphatase n=1 Tax=Pristionchus pacificus TaxID=54126 RepID=A0A2A6CP81_PRIPA|nr:hypothetical protein PRIPAC_79958 [Pristionchus pacificus]|eukprot:PDM80025.1 Phosphatase [Pristionchus pacificus]